MLLTAFHLMQILFQKVALKHGDEISLVYKKGNSAQSMYAI